MQVLRTVPYPRTVPKLSNGAISMTLNDHKPRFQGHAIINAEHPPKRYEIGLLQRSTNRDLHVRLSQECQFE